MDTVRIGVNDPWPFPPSGGDENTKYRMTLLISHPCGKVSKLFSSVNGEGADAERYICLWRHISTRYFLDQHYFSWLLRVPLCCFGGYRLLDSSGGVCYFITAITGVTRYTSKKCPLVPGKQLLPGSYIWYVHCRQESARYTSTFFSWDLPERKKVFANGYTKIIGEHTLSQIPLSWRILTPYEIQYKHTNKKRV